MLLLLYGIEHATVQKEPLHALCRGKVPGLYLERLDLIVTRVDHFDGVTFDRAVVSLGVAEAFEGEGRFGHARFQ